MIAVFGLEDQTIRDIIGFLTLLFVAWQTHRIKSTQNTQTGVLVQQNEDAAKRTEKLEEVAKKVDVAATKADEAKAAVSESQQTVRETAEIVKSIASQTGGVEPHGPRRGLLNG